MVGSANQDGRHLRSCQGHLQKPLYYFYNLELFLFVHRKKKKTTIIPLSITEFSLVS